MPNRPQVEDWATWIGYDEFVESASHEVLALGDSIRENITLTTVQNALIHPNGFLVHTILNTPEGQLRLHIWPTGRVDDLTPHSHPWHMASLVLAGTYTEHIPDVHLDDKSPHELMIPIFDDNRQNTGIGPSGRTVSFDLGELIEYEAGDIHRLPAGAFHATPLPQVEPIITLLRTGQQMFPNPSFVKRAVNQQQQLTVGRDRQPPSPEGALVIWESVAKLLNK